MIPRAALGTVLAASFALAASALAQQAQQRPAAPPTPRQAAPHDVTGAWVSVVTEDWRWRMITPRVPGRIRIGWEDDDTLKVETDAGTQTRLFHFGAFQSSAAPTWQGDSVASWEMVGARRDKPPAAGG